MTHRRPPPWYEELDARGWFGTLERVSNPSAREDVEDMTDVNSSALPRLTAEQRVAAAKQFERANQVLAAGDYDYAAQLLFNCCRIDPGNATYRQALRQTQKQKHKHNGRGQNFAFAVTLPAKWRLRRALRRGDPQAALEQAELVLMRNPWDKGTHLRMAEAFDDLDLINLAVWTLEQIRGVYPQDPKVNRPLAHLYEKRGNFTQAIALYELIRKAVPQDLEAQHKVKDLAASATIAKGRYQEAIDGSGQRPILGAAPEADAEPLAGDVAASAAPPQGQAPKELTALLARVQANPSVATAHQQLAAYYRRAEQFERAREVLVQGLAATGNHFELALELLDLDTEPFRRDLAVAEEKLREQPNSAELQRIRNGLVKEINARELDYYRKRCDRFPTDVTARFELALRLLRGGQHDEAIREFQAIRTDPRYHGRVLFYLGLGFKQRNNWRLAQRNLEEALPHLDGSSDLSLRKEALYQLAVGWAEAGDLPRAVDLACDLVNLDFSYKNISQLLDTWQAKVS
jgi:tetratricopeptide (TPR) repeat protein